MRFKFASFIGLVALAISPCLGQSAPEPAWRHALSLVGTPKYPSDFKNFDYVNPSAPKGGTVRLASESPFDSFNFVIPRGSPAGLVEALVFERLSTQSLDEISTEYGVLSEAVRHADDFSWAAYRLRPNARWHDGEPVTAEDVIWSFEVLTANNPRERFYYRNVEKAEKTGEREVTFTFKEKNNRENPLILGQLTILPKHWWTAKDPNGVQRDVTKTSLEPPMGSGPYRVSAVVPGRSLTLERVKDWWGKDLPVNVGRYNFDQFKLEIFRDETVEFEAFKADQFDWRTENSVLQWMTRYDFPALRDNRVIKEEFPDRGSGIMQAFVFNIRRDKFKDPKVRRAFNLAFDFEEANKSLFFSKYTRINSYFFNTDLASKDLPTGAELDILNSVKDQIPPEVFTKPYVNPVGGSEEARRNNLRDANRLLGEAGWVIKDRALVNAKTGERFAVEFLLAQQNFERIVLPYKSALERLGLNVSIRIVDPSQYITRQRARDYDIIVGSWPQSLSPGNEQLEYWGSEAADREGSRNLIGIKNPAIDTLINRVIYAKDRAELEAATKALDRVLLWNDYVVPQWARPETWTARWDRFGRPDKLPRYNSPGFPDIWWYDEARAAKTGARP